MPIANVALIPISALARTFSFLRSLSTLALYAGPLPSSSFSASTSRRIMDVGEGAEDAVDATTIAKAGPHNLSITATSVLPSMPQHNEPARELGAGGITCIKGAPQLVGPTTVPLGLEHLIRLLWRDHSADEERQVLRYRRSPLTETLEREASLSLRDLAKILAGAVKAAYTAKIDDGKATKASEAIATTSGITVKVDLAKIANILSGAVEAAHTAEIAGATMPDFNACCHRAPFTVDITVTTTHCCRRSLSYCREFMYKTTNSPSNS
ncbi:hypothetical protein V500_10604 [Pseudogymnoascus sp. VKM F-4518 (FW-2643)]|nr:hypothetical protein V500_10604 [Pseudogymnoascus sp. VKM F-4518 (FW-2643)]